MNFKGVIFVLLLVFCFSSFFSCVSDKHSKKNHSKLGDSSFSVVESLSISPVRQISETVDTASQSLKRDSIDRLKVTEKTSTKLNIKKHTPTAFVGVDIHKYRVELRYGGTMAKALSLAGQPTRKKSFANQQIWFYNKKCFDSGFHKQCIRFVIIFVNGKCASVECNDNLYYN